MTKELTDRAATEWAEIDRVMSTYVGEDWSQRELCGSCEIVVDRVGRFVTFLWPQDDLDLTLVAGHVVTCGWQRAREVCVTVFDSAGQQVQRRFEPVEGPYGQ